MKKKYDYIIIGAGIGGLISATLLSKKGKSVLILEKNSVAGGYATNFKRKDFVFDAGLHIMNGCEKKGTAWRILKQCGILKQIKFIKLDPLYKAIFPKLSIEVRNLSKFVENLVKIFPKETSGIRHLFYDLSIIHKNISSFENSGTFTGDYLKTINISCTDYLSKYVKNKKLQAIIMQQWQYFGLPPEKLPCFYLAYPLLDYLKNGGYYPLGGAFSITKNLIQSLEKYNAKILLNSEAKKIIFDNAMNIKGVTISNGNTFFCNNIIANIAPKIVMNQLVGKRPFYRGYTKQINSLVPSISAFQIYIGLSIDLKIQYPNNYEFLINSSFNISSDYKNGLKNNMLKAPCSVTIYSNIDNTCSPNTKSVMVVTVFAGYNYWKILSRSDYLHRKNIFANSLLKRTQKIVKFKLSDIESISVATPLTMERYTGNPSGAIYGSEQSSFQAGYRRTDFKSPIKNLYFVGAWTRPGGGITGVMLSGATLAKKLLTH